MAEKLRFFLIMACLIVLPSVCAGGANASFAAASVSPAYAKSAAYVSFAGVTIKYLTADGAVVGEQVLGAVEQAQLTPDDLTLPKGYKLERNFSAYVIRDSFVNIVVTRDASAEKPFIKGMGNLKFEPNAPMRRIDAILMIYNLLGEGAPYFSGAYFYDAPTGLDEKNAVSFAVSRGIITGYEDGALEPFRNLTRAEFAVIMCKAYGLKPNDAIESDITDIAGHWSALYVMTAAQNGLISGYDDKTFKPDKALTRAEAVTIASNAEKRSGVPLGTARFSDVSPGDWFYRAVMNAAIAEM